VSARVLFLVVLLLFVAACGPEAWDQDPQVQAAKAACKGLGDWEEYACIERHAVKALNPDVCRLAGIWIDDMCLQAVYEAADDPTICDRIYLQGVRPNCRAYYESRAPGPTASPARGTSPLPAWDHILKATGRSLSWTSSLTDA